MLALRKLLTVREVDIRTSIRPTVAEVDMGALKRNAQRIRSTMGPGVAIYGVVKADAYGHGAVAVGKALAPLCEALAVSLVEEGLELRAAGITAPIVVLGGYYERCRSEVLEEALTPVIYDAADLERFGNVPVRRKSGANTPAIAAPVSVHVKVDTGMNRLGVTLAELPGFFDQAAKVPGVRIDGLCTHLASADLADDASTRQQLEAFDGALAVALA